jgi:hypothetical protein
MGQFINITAEDMRTPECDKLFILTDERKEEISKEIEEKLKTAYVTRLNSLELLPTDYPNRIEREWVLDELRSNGFGIEEIHTTNKRYMYYKITW